MDPSKDCTALALILRFRELGLRAFGFEGLGFTSLGFRTVSCVRVRVNPNHLVHSRL